MNKELIVAITVHKRFGNLFTPLVISKTEGGGFYTSIEKATVNNIKDLPGFSEHFEEIVRLFMEYDESGLYKSFNRTYTTLQDFVNKTEDGFIAERIRPYIERRIIKIITVCKKAGVRFFLKQKGYAQIYESDEIKPAGGNAEAVFNFIRNDEGIRYNLEISYEEKLISLRNSKAVILTHEPCVIALHGILYRFNNIDSKKIAPFLDKEYISVPKQTEKTYLEKFILNTIKQYRVIAQGFKIVENNTTGTPVLYLQNDLQSTPMLLLKYKYGKRYVLGNSPHDVFVDLEQDEDNYIFFKQARNHNWENRVIETVKELGLSTNDNSQFYNRKSDLGADLYSLIYWINVNHEKLKERGIELKQEFFPFEYYLGKVDLELSFIENKDWFDIKGKVQLGKFEIPFVRLKNHIINGNREFKLPDDTIAILPEEWFVRLQMLFQFAKQNEDGLKLSMLHFSLVEAEQIGISKGYYQSVRQMLQTAESTEENLPKGLNAQLRPYQQTGYNWLMQLKKHQLGGCLADDMGLGKTLQTLTLLLAASKDETITTQKVKTTEFKPGQQLSLFDIQEPVVSMQKTSTPTSLIVMPASLVFNWKAEIERFTPSLQPYIHTGANRSKSAEELLNYQLILTTYGTVRNDTELLSQCEFHYIVLDESQAIKNPQSKNHQAINQLNSKYKLVLTGTPIENSLSDLWAQMNFVNEGLLGNHTFFIKNFADPIEKQNDEKTRKQLQQLIQPFILRRKKGEVAKELPPLTEQIHYCDMEPDQFKRYEEIKSSIRNELLLNDEKPIANSSLMIIQALNQLRQVACHPKMLGLPEESGKFNEVIRMLDEVVSEGYKILVFSSFVKHLSIFEAYLKENNIGYCLLTGQTKDRETVINEFQNDLSKKVFLISLKAGGVGLNLTAAEYVFMLDPWWNPAAESQAIARAHRMGQQNNVFVYRFIASNSVEEKILKLQDHKRALAEAFVESNNPFKALSEDEIKALFE